MSRATLRTEYLDEHVLVVRNAFSDAECDALLARAAATGYEEAGINAPGGPVRVEEVRSNDRAILDDPPLAQVFWDRLGPAAPASLHGWEPVGVNERFRFYRYRPGQQFHWHGDGSFRRENGERSLYTLMVYLNDGFEGGETEFPDTRVVPVRGMALLFYHFQYHRGAPVVSGVKHVVRTDVMYRCRNGRENEPLPVLLPREDGGPGRP